MESGRAEPPTPRRSPCSRRPRCRMQRSSPRPPPMAAPFTRAMVGFGDRWQWCETSRQAGAHLRDLIRGAQRPVASCIQCRRRRRNSCRVPTSTMTRTCRIFAKIEECFGKFIDHGFIQSIVHSGPIHPDRDATERPGLLRLSMMGSDIVRILTCGRRRSASGSQAHSARPRVQARARAVSEADRRCRHPTAVRLRNTDCPALHTDCGWAT